MPNQTINLRIERRQDVLNKVRFSRSTLYSRIQQGLFVPPVSLLWDGLSMKQIWSSEVLLAERLI